MASRKTLVLFVHHEQSARTNYFINHAIFLAPNVDFIIISNGCDAPPNLPPYVTTISRPNIGYDFGGWSEGLLHNNLYQHYTHFIFMNSSVYGPIPRNNLPNRRRWTDIYLDGLQGNIKLFGSTINCHDLMQPNPKTGSHVQSYAFCMDMSTLQLLMDASIFSVTKYAETFRDAIVDREIRMSRVIIGAGYNIGCLMQEYQGIDFRFIHKQPRDYPSLGGDIMGPIHFVGKRRYFRGLVFVKGNRLHLP